VGDGEVILYLVKSAEMVTGVLFLADTHHGDRCDEKYRDASYEIHEDKQSLPP